MKSSKAASLVNIYEKYLKPGTNTVKKTLERDKKIIEKYKKYKFVEDDELYSTERIRAKPLLQ